MKARLSVILLVTIFVLSLLAVGTAPVASVVAQTSPSKPGESTAPAAFVGIATNTDSPNNSGHPYSGSPNPRPGSLGSETSISETGEVTIHPITAGAVAAQPPYVEPTTFSQELRPNESAQLTITVYTGERLFDKGDVVFVLDRTGSMGDEIDSAKASAIATMEAIKQVLPFAWFGVGSFMDYPGYYSYPGYSGQYGDSGSGDVPWQANMQPTDLITDVSDAINQLTLGYGADGPESYTRALFETLQMSWRSGTKKVVVLYGDAPTHDLDFAGFNHGGDPGRDSIAGTSDDLDFEAVVNQLAEQQISVIAVNSGSDYPEAEPTFRGMSEGYAGLAGTSGRYFVLENSADLPNATVQLIRDEISRIDSLSLKVTEGYESWFTITPASYTNVPAATTKSFSITIKIPSGTSPGYYPIMVQALGDEVIFGTTYVGITVPSDSPTSDIGFNPSQDGYAFANSFGSQWNWEMFQTFFGKTAVEHPNGNKIGPAQSYFDLVYKKGLLGGTCDGFTSTSLLNYHGLSQPNAGAFALSQSQPLIDKDLSGAKDALMFAQGIQAGLEVALYRRAICNQVNSSPHAMFEFVKSQVSVGRGVLIGISWDQRYDKGPLYDEDLLPGGHSLLAYRYEDPPGNKSYLYVYDPNLPRKERKIEFDYAVDADGHVVADSWGYDWHVPLWSDIRLTGDANQCQLRAVPIELYRHNGVAPWMYAGTRARLEIAETVSPAEASFQVFLITGAADPLFIDDQERKLGWRGGVFYSEIPEASYSPVSQGTTGSEGQYLLPTTVRYTLELRGTSAGTATVTAWGTGYMAQVADLLVSPSSLVQINIPANGGQLSIVNTGTTTNGTLVLNQLQSGQDLTASVSGLQLDPSDSTTIQFVNDTRSGTSGGVRITGSASTERTYDLSLARSGGTGYEAFGHSSLQLLPGSTVQFSPSDWSQLDTVTMQTDLDQDGDFDESETVYDVSSPAEIALDVPGEINTSVEHRAHLVAYIRDQFGAPTADGTPLQLSTSLGSLSVTEATTVGGYVETEISVGDVTGVAVVSAQIPGTGITTSATISVTARYPKITSFVPASGAPGTLVTLSGLNFAGTTSVKINGIEASNYSVASDTQIIIEIPVGATTGKISVVTGNGTATSATDFTVTTPDTWTSADIGIAVGTTAVNGNKVTITSRGGNFWSTADGHRYYFRSGTGDQTFIGKMTGWDAANIASAKAGLTLRSSTDPSSSQYTVHILGTSRGLRVKYRPSSGAATLNIDGPSSVTLPVWLKLVKSGNTVASAYSTDGINWTSIGTPQTISGIDDGYVYGLAAASASDTDAVVSASFELPAVSQPSVYLSPTGAGAVGPTAARKSFTGADILSYVEATNTWDILYDGSYVKTPKNLGAFAFVYDDLILGFSAAGVIPGLGATTVPAQDLVKFTPARLGYNNTAGTFALYFDGSDVGLTTSAEAIDAVWIDSSGRLYISTLGTGEAPVNSANPTGAKLKFQDEDILRFTPSSLGATTAGMWEIYWDPTLVTGMSAEDINGYWEDPVTGDRYVTILGGFTVGNAAYGGKFTGNGKTILRFAPNATAPGGWAPVEKVQWLATGATFPSNLDGVEMGR